MNIIRLKRKVPENLYDEVLHDQNYYKGPSYFFSIYLTKNPPPYSLFDFLDLTTDFLDLKSDF